VAPRPSVGFRLLVVSRLVERKGIGNVITAMAELPGAELVVAGGPPAAELAGDPEARRLTALAERLGVARRVRLLGRVGQGDLPALYRSADLVVNVPWYEPFGIVPLEAMACGVPVVASAVGGLVDTVVDGVNGVHVPPRRPGLVAAAVAGLLADPERRAALGATGARRARRRYGWDRIARSTLEVYAGLPAGQLAAIEPLWTTAGTAPSGRLRSPTGGLGAGPGQLGAGLGQLGAGPGQFGTGPGPGRSRMPR
jgi:glycosyltransferase involved in cell wall biosynthesis